jgi:hypothetical protein
MDATECTDIKELSQQSSIGKYHITLGGVLEHAVPCLQSCHTLAVADLDRAIRMPEHLH